MKLEEIRAERDSKIAWLLRIFGVIMAIFYFVVGLMLVFLPLFNTELINQAVGVVLCVYGIYRFVRWLKHIRTTT